MKIFRRDSPETSGKLLIVPDTFDELLALAGDKLGLQAGAVYLQDGCQVEAIEEVEEGDFLYFEGVDKAALSLANGDPTASLSARTGKRESGI